MKNMNIKIILLILFISVIILLAFVYDAYKQINTPFLKSITVLGTKVNIEPNIYVYDVHLKNGKIDKISNGCELPYHYEVNDMYVGTYDTTSGGKYFENGEKVADFSLDFYNYNVDSGESDYKARYYFKIFLDEPLRIAEGC